MITLLDYGAGNVRSVINSITKLGHDVKMVSHPQDIANAERLIFPGVGSFGSMMRILEERGFVAPLREYLSANRPFLGICLGMQALLEGSEESPGVNGLGLFKGTVKRFDVDLAVPHIGWNGIVPEQKSILFSGLSGDEKFYFVHSFYVDPQDEEVVLTRTDYGRNFVSALQRGNVIGTQFHPEKSGAVGLQVLKNFIENTSPALPRKPLTGATRLAKRIIACLDVRSNDDGDLVVTKGDQYDVREAGAVRNLGAPVELAERYYAEGADEITFLNITGFRDFPLKDMPMLEVLKQTSKNVFVPLTIGGGIRNYTDENGRTYSALEVASEYFRSGADKVSIGSDAVYVAIEYIKTGKKTGTSPIETISEVYGSQAVVISVDPRRVYVRAPEDVPHRVIETEFPGPNGERYCWYECTVKGGREGAPIDAVTLARVTEELGAGEILLNCIDKDGTNSGFDIELIAAVKSAVNIPVIASSGAGKVEHFSEVFNQTDVESALAAGIFHRREVPIESVKNHLQKELEIRK
ncbi:MAG: imidazole glycerol phosphate synthase subunit HisF [Deltaproteobacteria bacterium]|nr:imidazole glycerol phosphate synthase subunit HisF [Deltaproteobacteria bacterium]MBN2673323.1 imidazole glycerol phosphate synthase subunit HisF [Deltaproteobacteria bacterium]